MIESFGKGNKIFFTRDNVVFILGSFFSNLFLYVQN